MTDADADGESITMDDLSPLTPLDENPPVWKDSDAQGREKEDKSLETATLEDDGFEFVSMSTITISPVLSRIMMKRESGKVEFEVGEGTIGFRMPALPISTEVRNVSGETQPKQSKAQEMEKLEDAKTSVVVEKETISPIKRVIPQPPSPMKGKSKVGVTPPLDPSVPGSEFLTVDLGFTEDDLRPGE